MDDVADTTAPPGRRAQKAAQTRRAIGEAAIDLFIQRGFAETTIDEIADRAGISRRSFFNYFETKQAAAFPDHEARLRRLEHHLAHQDRVSFDGAVALIIEGIEDFVGSDMHRKRYQLLLDIPELREQDMRDDLDYEDVLTAYFLSGNQAPGPDERFRAHQQAARIVGTFRAALTTWALAEGGFDPAAAMGAALARER